MKTADSISLLRIYWKESAYALLASLRMPAFAIPTMTFPLVFYVFFGVVFGRSRGGFDMAAYLLATYGTFAIMAPALFGFGVSLAIERSQGWLTAKQATAMPPSAYLAAKLFMAMVFAAAVVLCLFMLGATLGDVRLPRSQWLELFAILVLGTLPFSALGLWLGCLLSGQAAAPVVNLVYLPMSILSGLWVPIRAFPDVFQQLAHLFPAYHLAQLGLGVIGMAEDQRPLYHVSVLAALTVVFLLGAVRAFYRQER